MLLKKPIIIESQRIKTTKRTSRLTNSKENQQLQSTFQAKSIFQTKNNRKEIKAKKVK